MRVLTFLSALSVVFSATTDGNLRSSDSRRLTNILNSVEETAAVLNEVQRDTQDLEIVMEKLTNMTYVLEEMIFISEYRANHDELKSMIDNGHLNDKYYAGNHTLKLDNLVDSSLIIDNKLTVINDNLVITNGSVALANHRLDSVITTQHDNLVMMRALNTSIYDSLNASRSDMLSLTSSVTDMISIISSLTSDVATVQHTLDYIQLKLAGTGPGSDYPTGQPTTAPSASPTFVTDIVTVSLDHTVTNFATRASFDLVPYPYLNIAHRAGILKCWAIEFTTSSPSFEPVARVYLDEGHTPVNSNPFLDVKQDFTNGTAIIANKQQFVISSRSLGTASVTCAVV